MSLPVITLVLGLSLSSQLALAQSNGVPQFVNPDHARVASVWLSRNPGYRVASDEDCNCRDDLKMVREESTGMWKANPGYHPYYIAGDFNWDGVQDVAFGVVRGKNPTSFKVVIFHGPFDTSHSGRAAFVSETAQVRAGTFLWAA